jgi:hypothetical protein
MEFAFFSWETLPVPHMSIYRLVIQGKRYVSGAISFIFYFLAFSMIESSGRRTRHVP